VGLPQGFADFESHSVAGRRFQHFTKSACFWLTAWQLTGAQSWHWPLYAAAEIRCEKRLGGLLKHYYRKAA